MIKFERSGAILADGIQVGRITKTVERVPAMVGRSSYASGYTTHTNYRVSFGAILTGTPQANFAEERTQGEARAAAEAALVALGF